MGLKSGTVKSFPVTVLANHLPLRANFYNQRENIPVRCTGYCSNTDLCNLIYSFTHSCSRIARMQLWDSTGERDRTGQRHFILTDSPSNILKLTFITRLFWTAT